MHPVFDCFLCRSRLKKRIMSLSEPQRILLICDYRLITTYRWRAAMEIHPESELSCSCISWVSGWTENRGSFPIHAKLPETVWEAPADLIHVNNGRVQLPVIWSLHMKAHFTFICCSFPQKGKTDAVFSSWSYIIITSLSASRRTASSSVFYQWTWRSFRVVFVFIWFNFHLVSSS